MTILSFYVLALVQANLAINELLSLETRSLAIRDPAAGTAPHAGGQADRLEHEGEGLARWRKARLPLAAVLCQGQFGAVLRQS
jgi:hypothetical protein